MPAASPRSASPAAISQIGLAVDLSPQERALEGRAEVDGAVLRAFLEAMPDPALQAAVIEVAREPESAAKLARAFTPYDGPGRRVVERVLSVAAVGLSNEHLYFPPPIPPLEAPLSARRIAFAKTALANAGQRAAGAGAWVDAPLERGDRRRRPRHEAEQPLEAARMVVRFGLGRCIRCDGAPSAAALGRSAFYCGACRQRCRSCSSAVEHAHGAESHRARDRDGMHAALARAARLLL